MWYQKSYFWEEILWKRDFDIMWSITSAFEFILFPFLGIFMLFKYTIGTVHLFA
jgi:hypothetical protein